MDDSEGSEVTVQEVAAAGRATLWCQVSLPSSDWTQSLTCVRLSCWSLTGLPLQAEDPLENRPIQYQMVALYDYAAQGPEDLEFSEGDTIDILGEGERGRVHLAVGVWSHTCSVVPLSYSQRGVVGRTLCRRHWHLPPVLRLQGERPEPRRHRHITALTSRVSSCYPPPNHLPSPDQEQGF